MIDANTATLHEKEHQEYLQARRDAFLRLDARRLLAQDYRDQFTYGDDWFQEALFANEKSSAALAKAIEDDDFAEAGLIISEIYDCAQCAYIDQHLERELEKMRY